jgi:DNA-binding YbaB/EbfC family protein
MQDNLKKVQDELALLEVTGSSGGGMVSVTITGKMEARRVRIAPSVTGDAEMLEDLVTAAFNDAVAKANEESSRRMAAATAGMPMPPGMKLPF